MKQLRSIKELKRGTIVRHITDGDSLVIAANFGDYAIAVRTRYISNPSEWLILEPETK